MRGLWLEGRSVRLRDDLPEPEPPSGEARVRVVRAGVCNTDLEMVRGYFAYEGVPGHEFVGVVEGAPEGPGWVGKRVVGEINASCRTCDTCRAGRPTHCPSRTVLGIVRRNGAHAQSLLLPLANLHEVPDGVADDAAVFTEPLAAALQIQEQITVGPGDRVVVVGSGKLGNLVAQTLALTGCDLLAVGRNPATLAPLAARGIRTATADAVPPGRADVAIECTGNPEGFALARQAVRPRGTIVLKSTYHGDLALNVAMVVVDELTLVGSRCGPFAPALDLLSRGAVDVGPLLAARYPLHDATAAYEHAARPGTLKVVIDAA
ncbi:MAG TPA: alcohol dehydrogenase catalytic domain-containing protein [Vicinamibacteria bacterium]